MTASEHREDGDGEGHREIEPFLHDPQRYCGGTSDGSGGRSGGVRIGGDRERKRETEREKENEK